MKGLLIAILLPFVQAGVRLVEVKYAGAKGSEKRTAALKYVKVQLSMLEAFFGPVAGAVDDSTVLGLIDSTVEGLHESDEFDHSTDGAEAKYKDLLPPAGTRKTKEAAPAPLIGELEEETLAPAGGRSPGRRAARKK